MVQAKLYTEIKIWVESVLFVKGEGGGLSLQLQYTVSTGLGNPTTSTFDIPIEELLAPDSKDSTATCECEKAGH